MTTSHNTDRQGLEVLSADECWELIGATPVGRVAFIHDGQPTVMPVNHRLVGKHILFLTSRGSKLDAAIMTRPVAFEVDHWNAEERSGWSVIVDGTSDVIYDVEELANLESLELSPWADLIDRSDWVRIVPLDINGRRLVPREPRPT